MSEAVGEILRGLISSENLSKDGTIHVTESPSRARSKIGESVHFSKTFILSYNLVLLLILFCSTLWYWGHQLARTRRSRISRRTVEEDSNLNQGALATTDDQTEGTSQDRTSSPSESSSTSNTLGTPSGGAKEQDHSDETTPLLQNPRQTSSRSPIHTLRSWLIYQPANIPIINKTLPSNATSLVLLIFLGLNVFYLLYRVPLSLPYVFVLADRAGLLFVANLPLLYILAAKNQPIKWLTGYSYETLNIIHRRLGEMMCFLALIHFIGMVTTWYTLLSSRISFSEFLAIKLIWLGIISFVSYEILYLTSLGSFRQKFYELFLGVHVVFQASALLFLYLHHPTSRPYVGIALAVFLTDRLIFRAALKSRTMTADLSIMEDGETVLLSSDWQIPATSWTRSINIWKGWKPTEHVFLTVPALSRKHIIQAHPFTIASAAPIPSETGASHAWFNLIIRARDGFSRDLLTYAQSHRSIMVRIDGPYGSLHALHMLQHSDHAVVMAGGSGIAVAYPLLFSILFDETKRIKQRITLIWVVHDMQHLEWIGQSRLDELRERGLEIIVPQSTMKAGRPDIDRLLREVLVKDCFVKDASVGVVVTGPDSMNRGARNTCARLAREGLSVSVSVEKFGW